MKAGVVRCGWLKLDLIQIQKSLPIAHILIDCIWFVAVNVECNVEFDKSCLFGGTKRHGEVNKWNNPAEAQHSTLVNGFSMVDQLIESCLVFIRPLMFFP